MVYGTIKGSGSYPHKITIQSVTLADDSYGGSTETWAEFAVSWAGVKHTRGGEKNQAGQEAQTQIVVFELRDYIANVTNAMRVVFQSNNYEIERAYDPDGMKATLVLETKRDRA